MAIKKIEVIENFIPSHDPDIVLHLREKKPKGMKKKNADTTLLMVHGQSVPGPIAFDFSLPGYSWMDFVANKGMNVFSLSVRGYGLSTRIPELGKSPINKSPIIRGMTAVKDIDAAVNYICKKNKIKKLLLLGYSWGTTTTAAYTSLNPKKIKRLALYAPFYAYDDPKRAAESEDPKKPGRWNPKIGSWRWVTESEQRERWDGSIPIGKHRKWRTEKAIKQFWLQQLKFDREGQRRRTPGVRIPNGPMADRYDRARNIPLYDAEKIKCPVLLIKGDHDRSSLDPEFFGLYKALRNSEGKRMIIFGDATHFAQFEWCRKEFMCEVQNFLEA
ncbi:MAG: hypothetical protein CMH79_02870 [Nitrospinae bacterium]|nr:hypothetical protein [Nitrospinota bacterium]